MIDLKKIYNKATSMLDEAYLICEDAEGKNINRAEKWIKQNFPEYVGKELTLPNGDKKTMSARDWVTQIRNDVPSSRLPKTENGKDSCKFLLGVTRLYFGFAKDTRQDEIQGKISQLEKIMKILTASHANEYDNNLNGLSYSDLDNKFKGAIQKNLDNEIASLKGQQFKRDTSYKFIPIPDFETSKRFSKWTSWCVTHQKSMYDSYTKNGLGLFYFCIKDNFESVQKVKGEGCPLDEYGKSMIAISVNDDGSLNTATCRWNHDNGGNDNIFKDAKEVSQFFGVNFFDTFKPRSVDELLAKFKKEAVPSKIADKLDGIETKNGLHVVKDRRVQTWKCIYFDLEVKCYAYDHFYWFDVNGNEIEAPQEIDGDFNCYKCASLTSLKGTPQKVGGNFSCSNCTSLTSLEGAPKEVGGNFYCGACDSLTSLEGAPQKVGGNFSCSNCTSLTSLEGAPQKVDGNFNCFGCKSLASLEGAPQKVDGNFFCYGCTSLTSLEGAPQKVDRDFNCSDCTSLTSLEGATQKVDRDFDCTGCKSLTSLKGAPQKVDGNFVCYGTKITSEQEKAYKAWLKTNPKENYKEFTNESTNMIDLRKMYEDAVMAAGSAPVSGGEIAAPSQAGDADIVKAGMTTDDVLGKDCDHHKNGYLGPGCFHVPSKACKMFKREILAGKKKKKQKNDYAEGMTVIGEADLDRQTMLAIHKIPERKILAFIKDSYDEVSGAVSVQSIAYNPVSKTYFIKFDDANDSKFKYVSAEFDGKQFLTADDMNVYDSAGMKAQFKKIMKLTGNAESTNWQLWTVWGDSNAD